MKNKINVPGRKRVARTPVVIQMEELECGAACLTMILAYCGLYVPLSRIRGDCDIDRDGVNAAILAKVALQYGVKARGFRYSHDALMNKATYPCMILWENSHFVVLNGFRGKHADINDPARGQLTLPIDEFLNGYKGFCMVFEPTGNFVPGGKPVSLLSFALEKLRGTKKAFLYMALTSAVSALVSLFSPAFSHVFINRLLTGKDTEWLGTLLSVMTGIAVIQLVSSVVGRISELKISGRLAAIGAADFFWHVLRLPVSFFKHRSVGDIQSRQEENETVASTLIESFAPLCFYLLLMILYLTVMLHYSIVLTCIGVASMVINLFLSGRIAKRRENISRVLQRDKGRLYGATAAGISMVETIKAGGSESGFFGRWADYQADVYNHMASYSRIDAFLGNLTGFISSLSNILVLFLGVSVVLNGGLTQGAIMAFQGYLGLFYTPVRMMADTKNGIMELRGETERLDDVMKHPVDPIPEKAESVSDCKPLTGRIEMRNITFGYSKFTEPILKDISFRIEPGERVAFVGKSGCGKSTVARLLTGLYSPQSGEVLYDGKKISEIERSVFTSSVGMVDQDIVLFDDTVSNNICLFDDTLEESVEINAAKDAQIHDEIMQRPGGYLHHMRENGRDYSGGQRQRIEIARALAAQPGILILDEATSALDAVTEQAVLRAIDARNITSVIIAHRLSAIRNCDRIYVLDNGKIVECGTHQELMQINGLYRELIVNERGTRV